MPLQQPYEKEILINLVGGGKKKYDNIQFE